MESLLEASKAAELAMLAERGVPSYAKINLFLEVVGKRADGYHNIESVFVEVEVRDKLCARKQVRPGVFLVCSQPSIPVDDANLVVKAVELVRRRCGVAEGMSLRLEKFIPPGMGLGGGSANAALALRMADSLWETRLSAAEMEKMALEIGSDVPFFLRGGTCLCEGRGEIMTRLPDFPAGQGIVLALPAIHSGTAQAYRGLKLPGPGGRRSSAAFIRAMKAGDREGMEREAFNRFEETVFEALPELGRLRAEMEALAGRPVRMSGSGAALWCFADATTCAELPRNDALAAWARQNRVTLIPTRARPSTGTGTGDIFLDRTSV